MNDLERKKIEQGQDINNTWQMVSTWKLNPDNSMSLEATFKLLHPVIKLCNEWARKQ